MENFQADVTRSDILLSLRATIMAYVPSNEPVYDRLMSWVDNNLFDSMDS